MLTNSSFTFRTGRGTINNSYSAGILNFRATFTDINGAPMEFQSNGLVIEMPQNIIGLSSLAAQAINTGYIMTQNEINTGRISSLKELRNRFFINSSKILHYLVNELAPHHSGVNPTIVLTNNPTGIVNSYQERYGTRFTTLIINSSQNPCSQ